MRVSSGLILAICLIIIGSASAQNPAWGVATVDDLRGIRLNPGYLGLGHGTETALMASFSSDSLANIDITNHHGFLMNMNGLGWGYERQGDIYRWTLGAGVGDRTFGIGYLRTWSSAEAWGDGWRNGWIFGMNARPYEFLAMGYSYQNTPEIPGLHTLGVGLRPATWRVTFFGEIAKPDATAWEDFFEFDWQDKVYYAFGGELHIVKGLRFFGRYDYYGEGPDEPIDNFTAGIRFDNPFSGTGFETMSGPTDDWDRYSIYSIASSKRLPSLIPMPKSALRMDLAGSYVENQRASLFGSKGKSFARLLRTLESAAEDEEVDGLIIKWRDPSFGYAQAEELRAVLMKFKGNGKPIVLYADYLGNLSYYLASVADFIAISPTGSGVNILGLRANMSFFKGTFDKVGIQPDFLNAGKYKSAMEMFTREEPSEFAAQNMNELLDALDNVFVEGIAESRNMTSERVRQIIDGGPYTDLEAIELGLVDSLMYWDEFEEYVKKERKLKTSPIGTYALQTERTVEWGEPDRIAVIVVDGNIVYGRGGSGGLMGGSRTGNTEIVAAIEAAAKNKSIKGILLRVDSGGGSAIASDLMAHALAKAAEKKPVVVSMGGAAASGGYYVSAPGYKIFADASTITGSIGVISGKFTGGGLYEKIGITHTEFKRGENSGIYATSDTFSTSERERMQKSIDRFYEIFKKKVADGRTMDIDSVETIAQGRVWAGIDAKEVGLVDSIGGFLDALDYLIEKCGAQRDDLQLWFMPSSASLDMMSLLSQVRASLPFGDKLENIPDFPFKDGETLYLMPYVLELR